MRIHLIACRVLTRELSLCTALSPHVVDITWLPQGLHETPDQLRTTLQTMLSRLEEEWNTGWPKHRPDAVALGYGLCSNGVVGLTAGSCPLVIPRTDDCIALFLGSQAQYLEEFSSRPGTFWLNSGWIGHSVPPLPEAPEQRRAQYAARYGEDNAAYLLQQDLQWTARYRSLGYIRSPELERPEYPKIAERLAMERDWSFFAIDGDRRLLQKMVRGEWDDREFLVCPPGFRVSAAYDGFKITATPPGPEEVSP